MLGSTTLATLKPAVLAVIACAMTYIAVAVDGWRLLRLAPVLAGGAAPSINLAVAIRIAAVGATLAGSLSSLAYSRGEGDLGPAALLLCLRES